MSTSPLEMALDPPLYLWPYKCHCFYKALDGQPILVFANIKIIGNSVGLLNGKEDLQAMLMETKLKPDRNNSDFKIFGSSISTVDSGHHLFFQLLRPRALGKAEKAKSLQRSVNGALVVITVNTLEYHLQHKSFDSSFPLVPAPQAATNLLHLQTSQINASSRFGTLSLDEGSDGEECEEFLNSEAVLVEIVFIFSPPWQVLYF